MKKEIISERIRIAANQNREARDYWLKKLSGETPKSFFPVDYNVPGEKKPQMEEFPFSFSTETAAKLIKFSGNSDVRLHMVMVGALSILLNKYTGNSNIFVGTPIYKQDLEADFINTILILKNSIKDETSFKDLMLQVKQTVSEANKYYSFPIELLMTELDLTSSSKGEIPLCDTAVLVENIHDPGYLANYKLNMIFSFRRSADSIEGVIRYNTLRYKQETVQRISSHFITLLKNALADAKRPLAEMDIMSEEEQNHILFDFNDTDAELPEAETISQLFEEQVKKTPGETAVIFEDKKITYQELNKKANRLAHALRKKGVGPDVVVGLILERSFEMIVAILGVMKAGGAYLPIGTDLPLHRVKTILTDSRVSLVITRDTVLKDFPFIRLQENGLDKQPKSVLTAPRPQVSDFNNITIPDRSLVDYEKYSKHIGVALAKNVVSLQATRGCPYQCAYCHKIWPKTHIYRTAENIFQEVKQLYDLGVRRFAIIDDIFNLKEKNSSAFFEMIIKNNMKLQLFFPAGMRGDILKKDYIDLMSEAGLVCLPLALETGSPRLQKMIKKYLRLDKFRETLEYFTSKHPHVVLDLFTMLGFPSETEEEAGMTLDFIKSIEWLHFPYIFVLHIYPGTDMEAIALNNGVTSEAIADSMDLYWHELPDTLPFSKNFARNYQTEFLNDYFLKKERLLHVLPYQMKVLTEEEIAQKYNTYLPVDIKCIDDLLSYTDIKQEELGIKPSMDINCKAVPHLNEKIKEVFPPHQPDPDALKVLILDLSQLFGDASDSYNQLIEPPLGPMYLVTHLHQKFGSRVNGKIAKSGMDFDSFEELKALLEEFKPDVIGMRTLTFYDNFMHQTAAAIRQWGFDVPIISGGPYGTSSHQTILQDKNIDIVVLGEGEITLEEIVREIMNNDNKLPADNVLKNIKGIAYVPGKTDLLPILNRDIFMMDLPGWDNDDEESGKNLENINSPNDLAYVIFTSGSTGKPKGVAVQHGGVVNMLHQRKQMYAMDTGSTSLQIFPYAFDGFVTSFFTPLISGAKTVLLSNDQILDMNKVRELITRCKVSHFISIPDFYRMIIENITPEEAASLECVTLAGDKIAPTIIEMTARKNASMEIANEYGITECSVFSTIYRNQEKNPEILIGKPIGNTKIYVVDKNNRIVPVGVPGEMCIGGVGLARGYMNNTKLTEERFVPNPYIKGEKMYKTGDLVRWTPEGNIQYIGRVDHQVKIRGFRIELGEIERRIMDHKAVKEAVVVVRQDKGIDKQLAAYYSQQPVESNQPILWPSVAEFYVYDDLLYYAMTNDTIRNDSYKVAINKLVKDKVVVDVGTGKDAILSRFCVEGGAKKVYALELLEETYKKAQKTIRDLGLEDKITLIHGDATTIDLPEKADVMVSEIVGAIGGSEGGTVILNKCRRLLKKDGVMIPQKSITKMAAATLPDNIHQNPGFTNTPGRYVGKIFDSLNHKFDLRLCIKNFPKSNLISSKDDFEYLDFSDMVPEESTDNINLVMEKDGRLDGFLVWLNLHTIEGEVIDILENEHCWVPVFVPAFYPGIAVSKGDRIEAVCKRTLDKNLLNPDFTLKGKLIRDGYENIEFEYSLPHFETEFRQSAFYRELFNKDGSMVEVRDELVDGLNAKSLRDYLVKKLPAYMIPGHFISLDEIPLTPLGKIDYKKLISSEMTSDSSTDYVAPGNELEELVADIWKDVLGVNRVGIKDNFFTIGGDSIKTIQIASRLNKAGYKIEMKDIFENPTVEKLTPFLQKAGRVADQSVVSGTVPLTPIQHAFYQFPFSHRHHFNQAVMLQFENGIEEKTLENIVTTLQQQHDALRMTYHRENDDIVQTCHGLDYPVSIQVFDLRGRSREEDVTQWVEDKADQIQASIDLENGPLMKTALFKMDDGDRVLFVVHHLVIDGVSWRILFEDIETLLKYNKGETPELSLKTDSFKRWSEKLYDYAQSEKLLVEKDYWKEIESTRVPAIKKDFDSEENSFADTQSVIFGIDEEQTTLLLSKVNDAFGTTINDILLTALGMGIEKTFGSSKSVIALEGHGREEILDDIDINRTVGWFTSAYPVVLDVSNPDGNGTLSHTIKKVKENLRRIPNKGAGYGILKYLTEDEAKKDITFTLDPRITFNYLGQFDADFDNASFKIAKESAGNPISQNNLRLADIDVSGSIADKRLEMSLIYNKKHFKSETIIGFLDNFKTALTDIISFCSSREQRELTPSDLTYNHLPMQVLDQLQGQFPGQIQDILPLSPLQEGMLFHAMVDDASSSYFQQASFHFSGDLDIDNVEKSMNQLLTRHDILRTIFVYKDIQYPVQVVMNESKAEFFFLDISGMDTEGKQKEYLQSFKTKDRERSFDLSKDALMRITILKTAEDEFEFIWSFHHVLMDGWCIGILNAELFEMYNALKENRDFRLPAVRPYRKYIQWLEEQDRKESVRYWTKYLEGFDEQTGIPRTKQLVEGDPVYRNERFVLQWDAEKTEKLNWMAATNNVTVNSLAQTAWGVLLGKYNDKRDIVFGSIVSGRPHGLEGVESMVGLFINTVPVRIAFEDHTPFNILAQTVQESAVAGEPHHYNQLAKIQSLSSLKQNLIDHVYVFENYPLGEQMENLGSGPDTIKISNAEVFEQTNYDLNLVVSNSGCLSLRFQYNATVYDKEYIEGLARQFLLILDQFIENESVEIKQLTFMTPEERNRTLVQFNDNRTPYPKDKTIQQLFREQVEKYPDRFALTYGESENGPASVLPMTYRQLYEDAARVAMALKDRGVNPGDVVGLKLERSFEMVIGIFGILAAGCAYLPIDTGFPQERIDFMMEDSGATVLLTRDDITHMTSGAETPEFPTVGTSTDLSYIIYTSGSTGNPKGVLTMHKNVTRVVRDTNYIEIHPEDRILQLSNYAFDGSVFDIFGALLNGAALVIPRQEAALSVDRLADVIKNDRVSVFFVTTALFNTLVDLRIDCFENVRKVLFGGERVSVSHTRKALEYMGPGHIVHMYGPTETTVYASAYPIDEIPLDAVTIPIGKPLSNTSVYILDRFMNPLPVGIQGELYIGGEGNARGYMNNTQLTTEKFIPSNLTPHLPHTDSGTLYRSGDLARWLPGGDIQFIGRVDQQVKIRGFRIEMGEIEHCLLNIEGIDEAIVTAREYNTGGYYLCAYYTAAQDIALAVIRAALAERLPEYMIPAYLTRLDQLPLNANGKVDVKALPQSNIANENEYVPPDNEIEEKLVEIWAEILELDKNKISVEADFFELGGHSLTATRVVALIYKEFDFKVPLAEMFRTPTIREIASLIEVVEWGGKGNQNQNGNREEVAI